MEQELLQLIVINIPNFVGFFLGMILMYRITMYTLEDNRKCREQLLDDDDVDKL